MCTSWCPLTLFLYQISLLVGHPDIIQCRHILVYPYVRVNVPWHSFSIRYHSWSATLLVFGVGQYCCIHEYELIFPDTLSLSDITPGRPPDGIQCWPILVYPCVRIDVPWHTFSIRYHSWSATLLAFSVGQYLCIHVYELMSPDTLSLSDITPGRHPDSIHCRPILVYPCVRVDVP